MKYVWRMRRLISPFRTNCRTPSSWFRILVYNILRFYILLNSINIKTPSTAGIMYGDCHSSFPPRLIFDTIIPAVTGDSEIDDQVLCEDKDLLGYIKKNGIRQHSCEAFMRETRLEAYCWSDLGVASPTRSSWMVRYYFLLGSYFLRIRTMSLMLICALGRRLCRRC